MKIIFSDFGLTYYANCGIIVDSNEVRSVSLEELIKLDAYPLKGLLHRLLQDKTTRKNILFASDSYAEYGAEYRDNSQMTENALLGFDSCDIQPRVYKEKSEQNERTRKKAEVFTPAWIVNQMNNYCDAEWFGRGEVFNVQNGQNWETRTERIIFPEGKNWETYVDSRRLEIACGEAPYIVSRYDTATGETIPIERRVGILDRKLRIVNENTNNEKDWFFWALRAFQSVYGYEYQGDNLLIARINLLYTLCEYVQEKWKREATQEELEKFLNVICWNFWQMDGIQDTVPLGSPGEVYHQFSLFEEDEEPEELQKDDCKIYDWRGKKTLLFRDLKEGLQKMKFDFVIGNPPYQEEYNGNSTGANSIYHYFYDFAFSVADKVELITPARFLFNAGSTPKNWNQKMLNDPHFKVLFYEQDSSKVFKNTDIKGGVAVTYRDSTENFGAIETFTQYSVLNSIFKKVNSNNSFISITKIVVTSFAYHFTNLLYKENPQLKGRLSKGHDFDLKSNVFDKLPEIFTKIKPDDEYDYIQILGRFGNERTYRFIKKDYVNLVSNLNKYKVFIAKANGAGNFGEILSATIVGEPCVGSTESFLSIGNFDTENEANNLTKYIKSKFARALLGVLKITQDITPDKWKYVPLQDFTENSDIDWTVSVAEIDRQLYRKYGLTPEEIDFIETHVKEMD